VSPRSRSGVACAGGRACRGHKGRVPEPVPRRTRLPAGHGTAAGGSGRRPGAGLSGTLEAGPSGSVPALRISCKRPVPGPCRRPWTTLNPTTWRPQRARMNGRRVRPPRQDGDARLCQPGPRRPRAGRKTKAGVLAPAAWADTERPGPAAQAAGGGAGAGAREKWCPPEIPEGKRSLALLHSPSGARRQLILGFGPRGVQKNIFQAVQEARLPLKSSHNSSA
jgi:hypothetical protein